MKIIRFIELFAGIGGFRYGLEKANDTITKRIQQGIRQRSGSDTTDIKSLLGAKQFNCVWANEWDKYACQIYRKNYGDKKLTEGDIRGIPAEVIPDHDLLTAGFPCQAFSIAGRRRGFEDTRGTLFFEICRIAKVKRPDLLLLENVKGLLNHQKGETFRIILNTLSELGYDCEWQVHNSKNLGVPQNRERVFIIGHFRGKARSQVFPLREDDKIFDEKNEPNQGPSQARHNRTLRGRKGLTPKMRAEDTYIMVGGLQKHQRPRIDGISPCLPEAMGKGGGHTPIINGIRRLTPIECERLQGFPDRWTKEGIDDIIDIEILKRGQLCQNVRLKDATIQSLLEVNNYVLSITKDGKNGGIQISLIPQKERTQGNVSCVIDLLIAENYVCDITNHGKGMEILYILKNTSKIDTITNESFICELMAKKSIYPLLKIELEGNLEKEKLSIIKTWTKEIIKNQIFTCVKTGKPITNAIIVWKKLQHNYLKKELLNLRMENIIFISDTQRYKCLGNAVTTNVVTEIGKAILKRKEGR